MTMFYRCDGCGGDIPTTAPAFEGRHDGTMVGDTVPPAGFHWCRLCSRTAFDAVAERRRRNRGGNRPGAAVRAAGDETTRFIPGQAGIGVDRVRTWLPQSRGGLDETRVMGEPPR